MQFTIFTKISKEGGEQSSQGDLEENNWRQNHASHSSRDGG
jgi:hypothetical protein